MKDDLELPIKSLVSQRWEDIPYYRELLDARERRGFLAGIEAAAKVAALIGDASFVNNWPNPSTMLAVDRHTAKCIEAHIRSIEPPNGGDET